MIRLHRTRYFLIIAFVLALCSCGTNSTKDEVPELFLPDDLEATLWAESPMFYNPTNIDVDARGRIWVTEAVNYRNFNNDSTRALHHSEGDRVVILEDTDGDGKADHSKVFVQDRDLVAPLGIAVLGSRVFVSCSPNLIVYTDENGDDIPDKKEVFLTGFGGLDHDHSLHAVVGGPDGNLYFNTGNAGPHIVTDKSGWTLRSGSVYTGGTPYNRSNQGNMRSDDGKVWVGGLALRMNPRGEHLRVVAHNFRNAYELAIDSRGDMWQNDNDDQVVACRTTWVMEGGNAGYFSADGTRSWQADQRPWQDVFSAHWHQDDPGVMPAGDNAGAGSPTGVAVNEGDGLGTKYRGMLLSADAGRNVVFGYHPTRKSSGYDLGQRRNFITSLAGDNEGYVWNDSAGNALPVKWFRPSDIAFGTDGALYVADWYDPVVGGHQMRDTTGYGRIYRITPKDTKLAIPKIDLSTKNGLIDAIKSPAVNVRYTAFQRITSSNMLTVDDVRPLLKDENPYVRARAIWLLTKLGDAGIQHVVQLLDSGDEDERLVAFRSLRNAIPDQLLALAKKLAKDPSPHIRREVAVALTDVPYPDKKDILLELAGTYDGEDRWYLEAIGNAVQGQESDFYQSVKEVMGIANKSADEWDSKFSSLAWRLHPLEAVSDFGVRVRSDKLDNDERSRAITALAFINSSEAVEQMIALTKVSDESLAAQATYWVTFRQGNDWHALWDWKKTGIDLEHERKIAAMKVKRNMLVDPQMPLPERRRSARDLARDPVGMQMLLGTLAEKQLPDDLYQFVEELIQRYGDDKVKIQAAGYFGEGRTSGRYSADRISALKGDASAGEKLFSVQCLTCHRLGNKGATIGPDLTAIGSKFDRRTLLEAVIDPNAGIVFGYEAWTISLKDGQSFFGFLVADGRETITIRDLTGKHHVLQTELIVSRKKQEQSLMPTPRTLGLSEQNLADIAEYLITLK